MNCLEYKDNKEIKTGINLKVDCTFEHENEHMARDTIRELKGFIVDGNICVSTSNLIEGLINSIENK